MSYRESISSSSYLSAAGNTYVLVGLGKGVGRHDGFNWLERGCREEEEMSKDCKRRQDGRGNLTSIQEPSHGLTYAPLHSTFLREPKYPRLTWARRHREPSGRRSSDSGAQGSLGRERSAFPSHFAPAKVRKIPMSSPGKTCLFEVLKLPYPLAASCHTSPALFPAIARE